MPGTIAGWWADARQWKQKGKKCSKLNIIDKALSIKGGK
jgi:hypothetical protein